MFELGKRFLAVALAAGVAVQTHAFSLIGPLEAWQTQDIGYQLAAGEAGGPMNLGEEYRWSTPTLVFAFDSSFLNFFGQRGVEAVEAAVRVFNDLPAAAQMSRDLREFPLDTRRFNYQALALRVRDLKSWTMSALMESLGLAAPERWAFTLRSRVLIFGIPAYTTIRRNFDPVTLQPSSYVNGTLYTYNIVETIPGTRWEAIEISVDPLAPTVTTVAALAGLQGGSSDFRGSTVLLNPGMFFNGLTRDDVGGIRYLVNRLNFNVENLPTNSIPAFSTGSPSGNIVGGILPWLPVGGFGTGGAGAGGAGGQPGGGIGGGIGGGAAGGTNNLVDLALRPGVEKLTFVRANFDSLLGQFFTNTVTYSDTFMTNGSTRNQLVQRILTTPDILFAAADLGVDPQDGVPILLDRNLSFQNNATQNGTGSNQLGGPGAISSPVEITFSKVGPFFRNFREGSEEIASRGLVWGSFDGSTNPPVVFPSGLSIADLEVIALRQSGGQPWRIP